MVTKRGDNGETDLLFGRRISKCDQRVVAIGAVDELNACLGLARVADLGPRLESLVDSIQARLVGLMGELAVLPEDRARYVEEGYPAITSADVEELTTEVAAIEEAGLSFRDWVRPGASGHPAAARLDLARTVCRRAEREVLLLGEAAGNAEMTRFLNRISDLVWVMARQLEQKER